MLPNQQIQTQPLPPRKSHSDALAEHHAAQQRMVETMVREALDIVAMLESPAWKQFILPVIGPQALRERAARTMQTATPADLANEQQRWQALETLRTELEKGLQTRLATIARSGRVMDAPLRPYYVQSTEPRPDTSEDGLSFDIFASEPPPTKK